MKKAIEHTRAIEAETKFQLDAAGARAVLAAGRVDRCIDQLNVYYDWEWRLADQGATFRMRLEGNGVPTMTLKVPLRSTLNGPRRMVELELVTAQLSLWPSSRRFIDVRMDLWDAFVDPLLGLGLLRLARVGWLRNKRNVIVFPGVGTLELDVLRLPGGAVYYEVEIESPDPLIHKQLSTVVSRLAPQATPARSSKFALFRTEASRTNRFPWEEIDLVDRNQNPGSASGMQR